MEPAIPVQEAGWPIIGHEEAVRRLRLAIGQGRLSHAYLFAGPPGVGKTALARAFAQAVCCPTPRPDPAVACGECRSCRRIARDAHPDVGWTSLTTQAALAEKGGGKGTGLTIETIRTLRASCAMKPLEARRRFAIVADAETMAGPAQEALLKTLEEPPPAVTLVLLADDGDALLPTIRSRCQILDLRPVPPAAIGAGLVAAGTPVALARELAALAGGSPGWALAAAADPARLARRDEAVERAIAWIAGGPFERLVTAVRLADGFGKRRDETFAELETVTGVWRDVMLTVAGSGDHAIFRRHQTAIGALAEQTTAAAAAGALNAVRRCLADLDGNVRPRLALEGMVQQWPLVATRP